MSYPPWLNEAAQALGLVPILAVSFVWFVLWRSDPETKLDPAFWIVGAGLAVSFPADTAQWFGSGLWTEWYVFLPLQVLVILSAFVRSPLSRGILLLGLLYLAAFSWRLSAPGPDFLVTIAGGGAIILLARGWLRLPLWIHACPGTLYFFRMSRLDILDPAFMPAWTDYQLTRLLTAIAFVGIIAPQVIQNRRARQWTLELFSGSYPPWRSSPRSAP